MMGAFHHYAFATHELSPSTCEGCLEAAAFLTIRGYRGNTSYSLCDVNTDTVAGVTSVDEAARRAGVGGDDPELGARVLAFIGGQDGPVGLEEVFKRLTDQGFNGVSMYRALWRLLDNRQVRLTPDRKLRVSRHARAFDVRSVCGLPLGEGFCLKAPGHGGECGH